MLWMGGERTFFALTESSDASMVMYFSPLILMPLAITALVSLLSVNEAAMAAISAGGSCYGQPLQSLICASALPSCLAMAGHSALALALEAAFGSRARVEMAAGGMHLLVRFIKEADDVALAKRAAAAGLSTSALSSHAITHDCGQGLLLSFTNIPVEAAPAMVARLEGLTVVPSACDVG